MQNPDQENLPAELENKNASNLRPMYTEPTPVETKRQFVRKIKQLPWYVSLLLFVLVFAVAALIPLVFDNLNNLTTSTETSAISSTPSQTQPNDSDDSMTQGGQNKIVLYANPEVEVTNLSLLGVYMIAADKESTLISDWKENLTKTLQELKTFYEKELPGLNVDTVLHPDVISGARQAEEYLLPDFLPEILAKSDIINTWHTKEDGHKILIIYIDGVKGTNEGGYGQSIDKRYVVNPAFWLEDDAIADGDPYGLVGSAHELGHGLGIPHPWEMPENTTNDPNFGNTPGDIMGYANSGKKLMETYFNSSVKAKIILQRKP